MTRKLWSIHAWVGLYAGLAIAFLSLTGSAALFREEFDRLLRPDLYEVEVRDTLVDMATVVEMVLRKHPDKTFFEVRTPLFGEESWNIRLQPKEKSELFPALWEVFVDPYAGQVLGERNYYKSFTYFLRNLHVRFYEGYWGRQLVGLAGIALLISTLTGLVLYFPFQKRKKFWKIRREKRRTEQADLHKLVGIVALLFNLTIAITGTWLGLQTYLMRATDVERPGDYVTLDLPLDKAADTMVALRYDLAFSALRQNLPRLQVLTFRPSKDGSASVEVLGDVGGQVYERASNRVTLAKSDLSQLDTYFINEAGFGDKLFYVQEALHFGDFGGIWLKMVYAFFGLTSGFLSISGFIIYTERLRGKEIRMGNFRALRPRLGKIMGWSLAAVMIVAILSLSLGIGVPTLLVSVIFYGFVVFWLGRSLYEWFRRYPGNSVSLTSEKTQQPASKSQMAEKPQD